MQITVSLVDVTILLLGAAVLVGVAIAYKLPRRFRPADITTPSDREAFRNNLIQTLTLVLVVLGAAVALKQLSASFEQLQGEQIDRLAEEVEDAEQRLFDPEGDEQDRLEAIADLASLHVKAPDLHVQIERRLQRFILEQARVGDVAPYATAGQPTADVRQALRFVVTEGQAQIEEDWRFAEGGGTLNLSNLDLRGLDLQAANLTNADLRGTILERADLRNAQMQGAVLTGANLAGANLQQAVLRDSTLANANLFETRLTKTDLTRSDLRGAVGLTWDQVRDASIACSTQLPAVLPLSSRDRGQHVPMLLVLRDCVLPTELRIVADKPTLVLFGTVLATPVAVTISDLGIALQVAGLTQAEARILTAEPGSYPITAEVAVGASPLVSALVARTESAVELETNSVAGLTGALASTPVSAAGSADSNHEPAASPGATVEATPAGRTSLEAMFSEFGDLDCIDFASREEAQSVFEQAGGPQVDLFGLDGDGNGIACEFG